MSSPQKPSRLAPAWIFRVHGLGVDLLVAAFTLLLGATIGIPASTQSNKSVMKSGGASETSYLRKAQQALEAHNLAEAKTQLELALRANPKSAEALLMLGFVELQSGDTAQAIEHFECVLKLNPESFSGHYNLALAHLRQQDVAAGLHELERAVALNPQHAGAAYNLGLVLLEMGRPEEALTQLRRAKALGPEGTDVSVNIARAELALHHVEEAKREADIAAKTFGNDPRWQATMGQLFLDHGQPQQALGYLTEALRLQPSEIQIRRLLASAQLATGNAAAVLALIPAPESAQDHYLLAGAFYLLRQLPKADEESRLAFERDPHDSRSLVLQARIRQQLGQHDAALELLKKATELTPQWSEPCYSAAVSYYFERRYAEAQRSLDRALELDPKSVRALFLYAASLVNEGKNRQAVEFLRRAIGLEPDNARFYYHLGALRLRDDRWSEAREAFEKAAHLKPDYALPHYQLGKLLLRSNHPQGAVRELETAVRDQPDLAQAYYQLGRAYTLLGETRKSEQSLATFAKLKQQELDEEKQMMEEVQRQSNFLAR
jgi:superkiller protein 3